MTHPPASSSSAVWTASDLASSPHAASDKADRVQAMFAAIARSYDLNNRVHSFGRDQAWRRRVVELAHIKASDRVLDAACGTGDLSLAMAAAGPASVVGLDFTAPMLDIARVKTLRQANRHAASGIPSPTFVQGDAMQLPFDDGVFDVVSIAFGIRNVSEPDKALREFRRVLATDGRLVILEFSEPRNRVARSLSRFYTNRVMPRTAAWLARDRSGAYAYLPRSVATFLDREALATLMRDSGFGEVTQHPLTMGVCVAYRGIAGVGAPA